MTEIENIQSQIKDLKELVATKDLALKLEKNADFQKLILDEFCEKECARFARMSGDPALSKENREDALALAQAAGHLRRWLSKTVTMGLQAEGDIVDAEETIVELMTEGKE